jgi:MFS family permease
VPSQPARPGGTADDPGRSGQRRGGRDDLGRRGFSFVADLRAVLAEQNFRRLFATRLISQAGDGIFTAGLGTYVFFNATRFPDPAAAAIAFAVLYLPYSLIGPFAGVFIDRWSRRQILVWSALLRTAFVVLTAAFIAAGALGVPLYTGALLVLGVNRFFLSALSAALPHVVPEDKLVMANSVAPTSGTILGFVGGIAGTGLHLVTGGGQVGSAITLLCGGLCYLTASLVATRMSRDLLGPARPPGQPPGRGLASDLELVAAGLAAGARHIASRRKAGAALLATGCHRFLYGILLLMSILLYRNYFYRVGGGNSALGHYTILLVTSAIGYATAALITPGVTRRLSKPAWVTVLLAAGGILTGLLGIGFRQPEFLVVGFALGVVSQGIAICTTTIIQEEADDAFLGRVFSVNDMVYNTTFVLGAAVSAAFMPDTGKSYPLLAVVAAGYLAAATGYRLAGRQPAGGPAAPATPSSSAQCSSS